VLKCSDRTIGLGKGGLKMRENLRRGRPSQSERRLGRRRDLRAMSEQERADRALPPVEASPEALQGPFAPRRVHGPDGGGDRAANDAPEEIPQGACRDAQSSDRIGEPDAEGKAAAATPIAIAAEDASSPDGLSRRAALVEAVQSAVPNELADGVAVRTRQLLEPQGEGAPLPFIAAKPSLFHRYLPPPRKIRKPPILPEPRIAG
jgi:hypothetical protein